MADELITPAELALWTQNDEADVIADPWAAEVLDKVSQMARFLGGQTIETWTLATAPFDVRMVALQVAKRVYSNPDQEVSTQVGPIGSRVLEAAALLMELTDSERATLTKYNSEGDPDGGGGLWVLATTRGEETVPGATYYVPDDSLSDWYIPMFSPGDPGDPAHYEDA